MNTTKPMSFLTILSHVVKEVRRSQKEYKHRFHSPEEAYGILRREYLELEAEMQIYKKGEPRANMAVEAIQLAAMCIKLVYSFWGYKDEKIDEEVMEQNVPWAAEDFPRGYESEDKPYAGRRKSGRK